MPPKKKKEPKNAYYFYMQDWRKWRAAEGQRFSLPEAAQFCNDDWKNLPESERLKYKAMEAEAKRRDKTDLTNKYTSLGVTFEEIEREEKAKRDAVVEMENCIATTLANAASSRESLMNQVFHLAHANVYCYWGQEKVYIPCEVAISKFSIARGVISTYHVFPAPRTANGKIPLGYKFQVKQNSDAVHGIPDPSEFPQLEYDYRKISSDIHNFLRPDGGEEIPPLYTLDMDETNNNCHISAVRTFFDNVAGDSYDNFRVYSLTKLFFKLYEACQQVAMREFCDHERAFPVEGVAHQQLLKDVYNFSAGLACEFHEEGEYYHNCSLSFVKRWVFLICEFCCSALRIEMIPGRHCVATAKIEITWASESKKKAAESRCAPPPVVDDGDSDDDEDAGAWSVIPKAQRGATKNSDKARTTADRIQQGIKNLQVDDRKELTIVKVPEAPRVFVMGQSPNVMSEIKVDDAPLPSVRLPTTRGRGEMLTRALNQQLQLAQQSSPGASFSSGDFPAIGEVRPGQARQPPKPSGSGWGRGFMM